MAQLAIRGHATRGKEVIENLGILGGENGYKLSGTNEECAYYEKNGRIHNTAPVGLNNFKIFTLEEFLEKFPYKVGDKVKCWINGYLSIDNIKDIQWDSIVNEVKYKIGDYWYSTINLQPYKEVTMETITIDDFKANTKEWLIDKLESMSKDNALQAICNIYDELHKPKYPKTYEECLQVLDLGDFDIDITYVTREEYNLHTSFIKLKRCRDAYWKIAGDWKPDWRNNQFKYIIVCAGGNIINDTYTTKNCILAFPTSEMRDAFYENFKDLIESCKELL